MHDDDLARDVKDALRQIEMALTWLADDLGRGQSKSHSGGLYRAAADLAHIAGRISGRLEARERQRIESEEAKPDHRLPPP